MVAAAGLAIAGCSTRASSPSGITDRTEEAATAPFSRADAERTPGVLLAYFSRAAENYYCGDRTPLQVGNTQVLAKAIAKRIGCAVYRIQAAHPYSDDYHLAVQRNVEEQVADARPDIAGDLPSPLTA